MGFIAPGVIRYNRHKRTAGSSSPGVHPSPSQKRPRSSSSDKNSNSNNSNSTSNRNRNRNRNSNSNRNSSNGPYSPGQESLAVSGTGSASAPGSPAALYSHSQGQSALPARASPDGASAKDLPAQHKPFTPIYPTPATPPPLTTAATPPIGTGRTAVPLSRLELLPTELVQKVFLLSTNLSLPFTSHHLHRHLADQFLQLRVLSLAYSHPEALTDLLSRRFFTSHILHTCESRHGPLDLTGALLPSRLLKPPFSLQNLDLLDDLASRGAALDAEDSEIPILALRDAIKLHCTRAITFFIRTLAVKCSSNTVALAIRAGLPLSGPGGIAELLRAHGEQTGESVCLDALIWWAALGRDPCMVSEKSGTGTGVNMQVLGYLLETSSPPGEVLGAVGESIGS